MIYSRPVGFVRLPNRTSLARVATLAVALTCGLIAGPAVSAMPAEVGPPQADRSWIAEVLYPVAARSGPNPRSHVKGKLVHYTAYSRRKQSLLVTGAAKDKNGRDWVRVHLPVRPNGSQGWVPADSVRLSTTGVRIHISIARRVLEVWRDGKRTQTIKVAVGAPNTPTTTGLFAVADPVSSRGHLGPSIIVLTAYSRVYKEFMGGPGVHAIHGWGDSGAFGRAVSNGCIRMDRNTVARLAKIVKPGTPVEISPN
jgi:lipoprotein-anchoring transpeptidase ErfK/SrfK